MMTAINFICKFIAYCHMGAIIKVGKFAGPIGVTYMSDYYGKITLDNGFIFHWMKDNTGEISGYVTDTEDKIVEKTNGWYRTTDPEAAAKIARFNLPA